MKFISIAMNKEAENKLMAALDREVFRRVGQVADSMGRECYLVGGAVRDILLVRVLGLDLKIRESVLQKLFSDRSRDHASGA